MFLGQAIYVLEPLQLGMKARWGDAFRFVLDAFVFIRKSLRLLPVSFFRRDSTLPSGLIPKTRGKILRI
jgi:hypothetical protein